MNVKEMLLACNIEQAAALHYELHELPGCDDWEAFLIAQRVSERS